MVQVRYGTEHQGKVINISVARGTEAEVPGYSVSLQNKSYVFTYLMIYPSE